MNTVKYDPVFKMNKLLREMRKYQNGRNIISFMVWKYAKQVYVLFINTHIDLNNLYTIFYGDNNPYIPCSGYC